MYALPSLLVSDCKIFSSLIQYLQDTFAKKKKKKKKKKSVINTIAQYNTRVYTFSVIE